MESEDKYLLGMLWKFGTIKTGTNQFVFQSYTKYEQMEYIRQRLAPDKKIKVSSRKDPRNGKEKTLYRLNFTNKEWADKVRQFSGINVSEIADINFVRGVLEMKGDVCKNGNSKAYTISGNKSEMDLMLKLINEYCNTNINKINIKDSGSTILCSFENVSKMVFKFGKKNPKYWGEILKKMSAD